MKKFIRISLILVFPLMGISNKYHEGDTLTVVTKLGLNLREEPNLKSQKIITIPYQNKVIVIKKMDSINKEQIENREGNWIYVSTNELKGFVFDGFLSTFKPINKNYHNRNTAGLTWEYIKENYSLIGESDRPDKKETKYEFEKEISILHVREGGFYSIQIELKNKRMSEALNLIQNLLATQNRDKEFMRNLILRKNEFGNIKKYEATLEFSKEIEIILEENIISINLWEAC